MRTKTLLLFIFLAFNLSFFANDLPHLNLEKYDSKEKKAAIELANQYYLLNNKDKALYYLKAATKRIADFYDAHIYIAHIYQTKKELKNSLKYIEKALIIDSTKAEAYYYRGYYHLCIADTLKAVNDYSAAIIVNPNFHYGYAAFNNLKWNSLLDTIYTNRVKSNLVEKMKKSNYLTVNINFNLGLFLFNLGAYNKALNKFKNCVTDEKYKSQSQFLMGKSYYYIREYDQALKSFSLAAGNNYKTDETKRYISHIYNISKVKKKK